MKRRPSRREFLRLGAMAAGSAGAVSLSASGPERRDRVRRPASKRVIVVGAGLAGLTAAYELTEAGHQVSVLEAQNRPGGRVRTLRDPFADGLHAELGAARIPDSAEWTLKYVRLFGLELVPFFPESGASTTWLRGTGVRTAPGAQPDLRSLPVKLTPEELKLGAEGIFGRTLGPVLQQLGESSAWPPERLKQLDGMTITDFLTSKGCSPDCADVFGFRSFQSASALEVLGLISGGHAGKTYKVAGGNDRLPKAFASRLADKIHYAAPVEAIEHGRTGVTVVYRQDGARRRLAGDELICTVPFSVLRRMEIAPPFSPEKRRAIGQMTYGSLSRITFQVRRRYWTDQGLSGFASTDLPGEIWSSSFDQPGPRGLLQLYLQGPSSESASGMSEEERVRYAADHIERVFPGLREHVEGAVSQCWDNDPWARGAVRLLNVGQVTELHQVAGRAEGRFHFAGEHTSRWAAWMNGAIESGHRAALEVRDG